VKIEYWTSLEVPVAAGVQSRLEKPPTHNITKFFLADFELENIPLK
jgi:hypothetical protein